MSSTIVVWPEASVATVVRSASRRVSSAWIWTTSASNPSANPWPWPPPISEAAAAAWLA